MSISCRELTDNEAIFVCGGLVCRCIAYKSSDNQVEAIDPHGILAHADCRNYCCNLGPFKAEQHKGYKYFYKFYDC